MVQMTGYVLSFSIPTIRQLWRFVRAKYAKVRTSIVGCSQQIRHSLHSRQLGTNVQLQPYKRGDCSSTEDSQGVPRSESSKSVNGVAVVPAPYV